MKNQFTKLALCMLLPVAVTFQSCTKDQETENKATVAMGSSTITGRITADLTLGNSDLEGVAGIKITGRISTADLVTNTSGGVTYATRTYEAITDANGNYTLTIEANTKPVTVTLDVPTSFNATQTLENGKTRPTQFTRNSMFFVPSSVVVTKGQKVTQNASYDYGQINTNGVVKLMGEVMFRNDYCVSNNPDSQNTVVPANTTLMASWVDDNFNSRETVIDVVAGKFTLTVDTKNSNKSITIRGVKFYGDRKTKDLSNNCLTEKNYGYELGSTGTNINKGETETRKFIFE